MDVWVVEIKKLYTGMRIEGYDINFSIFINHENALKFAWNELQKYQNKYPSSLDGSDDEPLQYSHKGNYVISGNGGYEDWPEFEITTFKKLFDPNQEVSLEFSTNG